MQAKVDLFAISVTVWEEKACNLDPSTLILFLIHSSIPIPYNIGSLIIQVLSEVLSIRTSGKIQRHATSMIPVSNHEPQ